MRVTTTSVQAIFLFCRLNPYNITGCQVKKIPQVLSCCHAKRLRPLRTFSFDAAYK